ncbi:AAHS family 4-hydroxybenzoate transporter-like MFS transporter [Paraburkholderia sp. RAU6.4a]|uniref:MFS transporter n=1 Tax=Paraburkholderia sp. RAU6.4a TaxID=2991067 RepID=UPI003D19A24F
MSNRINVREFLDSQRFSPYHGIVTVLCFLAMLIDGFDNLLMGHLAPAIKASFDLEAAQVGPLIGAGLLGIGIGSFTSGPLADRFGRKLLVVGSVGLFGICQLASAFAPSLTMLIVLRFLTGLGFGGAMPNAITLTAEFCPKRWRPLVLNMLTVSNPLGGFLGSLIAAALLAGLGWRNMFLWCGAVPLLLVPVLWTFLPDSVRFLLISGKRTANVEKTLRRISPHRNFKGAQLYIDEVKLVGSPVGMLFRQGLLAGTVALWCAQFFNMAGMYFLMSWLPTLIHAAGLPMRSASLMTALLMGGGVLGCVADGFLMSRFNAYRVIAALALATAVLCVAFGQVVQTPSLIGGVAFVTGFTVCAAVGGMNFVAADFYPTANRATGVSWMLGIGRLGSVGGVMAGGLMLSAHWDLATQFIIASATFVIAAASIFTMRHVASGGAGVDTATTVPSDPLVRPNSQ